MAFPISVATDADLHLAKNNLSTTLAGAIDSTTTTVILTDASSFPSTGFVTIESEIIQYTGISVNTLTGVTRGADGTPQAAHADLTPVNHFVIAAHHNALKDELIAVENELSSRIGLNISGLRTVDGSSTAPAYAFVTDTTMGIFHPTANAFAIAQGGVERWRIENGIVSNTGRVLHVDGTVALPGISFVNDPDLGIFRLGVNVIGIGAGNQTVMDWDDTTTSGLTRVRIFDNDNASLERISVGAADSGGTGFKVLRIPN